jgi:hypothetical protein
VKKRHVLVAVLALLVLFAVVSPVMAEPPTNTPVRAVQQGSFSGPDYMKETKGGVRQTRGMVNTGTIKLYIPDSSTEPEYVFILNSEFDITSNTKLPVLRYRVDVEWIYEEDEEILGTFKGEFIYHGSTLPTAEVHGVLQGTGIFKGQKLMLSRVIGQPGPTWAGFLFTR